MNPDTALAISSELSFVLKSGWTFTQDGQRFRVRPPGDVAGDSAFEQELRDEVWRVARFVAYADYASISKVPDGGYSIVSRNAAGNGFEIVFEAK